MAKRTLKHVWDGFRSSAAPQTARTDHVAIPETLKPEHFRVAKTVRHGFPYQPTCMAWDPLQKLLAIGTKHGAIKIMGCPGVDTHVCHDSEAAVLFMTFLINEGALISATSDSTVHMWSYRQTKPEIIHSVKFQREKITSLCLPFQSKFLYVGSDRGNVHVVNIETFLLSGYIINWNKAIDLSRKSHPGAVVHLSDCPVDPGKLLIAFDTGQLVFWDLKTRTADCRYQTSEPLRSVSWHHEGKQFMCSHTDGSLTTWVVRQPTPKATATIFPHAKTNKEGKQETCKSIQKVEWSSSKTGESFIIFSGGLSNDRSGRTPSITVIHGKTTTVLEMEHNVVDFMPLCEGIYPSDFDEPHALVVLLHNDLVVVDLLSQGYPCFENPYSMDLHESPVTCCTYLADCPLDLISAYYTVGARSNKPGFSTKDWPLSGGEWGTGSGSYPEVIITGHADGSLKFWDSSAVGLQVLYKLKTAKVFEKDKTRGSGGVGADGTIGEDDPFAIQHISICPESRLLCVAGASSHLILYKYSKTEALAEVACLEIPIVWDAYDNADVSPECEFPPRPNLQSIDYFLNIHVKAGVQKKPPGYQAELVCLTPWVNGEPPGQITSLSINSCYGLIAYGNESGLVIVDYIQNTCLLNMGTPELYGAADPYQRVPRSPKKSDSKDKDDERDRSPSSDQDGKDNPSFADQIDSPGSGGEMFSGSREELLASVKPMKKIESRGRGELDLQKHMIRKYSRMKSFDENQPTTSGGIIDIMKFLRKEKPKKEEKSPKEENVESEIEESKDIQVILEPEITSPNLEEAQKSEDNSPSEDVILKTNNVDLECSKASNYEKKGRSRLRDTFSKFDAKVRRVFSLENNPTIIEGTPSPKVHPESPRLLEEEIALDSQLEKVMETEAEEVIEEIPVRAERQPSIASSTDKERSPSLISEAEEASEVDGVKSPARVEDVNMNPFIEDHFKEDKFITEENSNLKELKTRPSLELFDELGHPIPPPRRNVVLLETNMDSTPVEEQSENDKLLTTVQRDESEGDLYQLTEQKSTGSEGNSPMIGNQASSPTNLGPFRLLMNTLTKKGTSTNDKLEGSFSRSRSSSISSLENISSESIQSLTFAESYVKKNDPQMLPTLWVGTNLGSVIQVIVSIPSPETRQTNPLSVFPSGTIFRLKGSILALAFLDYNGALIKNNYEVWRDPQKERKERTPTKSQSNNSSMTTSTNKLSPTNSGSSESTLVDKQYIVFCSEKVARVVALPSQNCVYKQIITEVSFVVKAEIIQMRDAVCLVSYVANGHISIFNLPSLRQLMYVDFLPLVDLSFQTRKQGIVDPMLSIWGQQMFVCEDTNQIARTFCFSTHGHGMYLCSPSEIQKFALSAETSKELQELLGILFLPCEMPEPPKQSFFKGLFGGGVSQCDRDELFGEASGKPASSVAKHIPGPMSQIDMANVRAGSAASDIARARNAAIERGEKLNELTDKTQKMMNDAEVFGSAARQLMNKYKDKKWYQI